MNVRQQRNTCIYVHPIKHILLIQCILHNLKNMHTKVQRPWTENIIIKKNKLIYNRNKPMFDYAMLIFIFTSNIF